MFIVNIRKPILHVNNSDEMGQQINISLCVFDSGFPISQVYKQCDAAEYIEKILDLCNQKASQVKHSGCIK